VGGERDHAALELLEPLGAARPAHVPGEPRGRLAVGGDEVAEAHGEIAEDAGGQLVQPRAAGAGHHFECRPDHRPLGREEPPRRPPHGAREPEPGGRGSHPIAAATR
jgi:hypothetical protein